MTIHFILYLFIVVMLLVTGLRALSGRGLALTLSHSLNGPAARPIGVLFVVLALGLVVWLTVDPRVSATLLGRASDPW